MEKTTKKRNSKLQLTISILMSAIFFLAELYVMINQPNNIVLVVGIAVLILIALYFGINSVLNLVNEKNSADKEQYDNIFRSEKTSYVLLKKNLDELSNKIEAINNGAGRREAEIEAIIKSQKAIAKVAVSKNKDIQDRLFIELNNIEASLNDSVRGLSEKLSGFQEEIERLADHIAKINTEAIKEAAKTGQEIKAVNVEKEVINESSVDELLMDVDLHGEAGLEDLDSVVEDSFENVEEKIDELDFGNIDFGELNLDVSSPVESEEDILNQLLATETVSPVEEEIDALAELAKAVDETPIPTPAPAPADNGGKMGQDDIAALIASMTGGNTEPEPEPIPEPTVEVKPFTPIDDNPNRMMTPEEIAALIAGM